jgi:hypothetical protein
MPHASVSKPCARAGCRELVTAAKPYILARKKYHSIECQVEAKKAAGWVPHRHLNHENRKRGGIASAKRTRDLQHRRKLTRAVKECLALIPRDIEQELSARGLALVKVLLGRAFELGRRREHHILGQQARRHERAEEKGVAA